jgi:ArsR family transcriptional regulator, virulence genes transcriptional regulator
MKITSLTPGQLEKASNMLKAIAHPIRIAILNHLEDGKKLSVSQLHNLLKIEQSTTSHHLGIMKDKGILNSKREGKKIFYYIKDESFNKIIDCVGNCACL